MKKRSIYFIGVLALFAIVIVGSASAFDLNSLFGDSSASEPQQISIEGINFTIPEGYTEEVNGSMDNEKLYRSLEEIPDDAGYFSLIIAKE